MIMCNTLLLGMVAILALHTGINENQTFNVMFWVYWVLAIVANTNWWRKIESKLTKGE
jgi:hypothetical protein